MSQMPQHKPGDVWKDRSGATYVMQEDGSVYKATLGSGESTPQQLPSSNPAASAIASAAQGYGISKGISSLGTAKEVSEATNPMVGFGSDAGTTLETFGPEMGGGEFISGMPYAVPGALGIVAGGAGLYDLFSKNAERGGTRNGAIQGGLSGAAAGAGIGTIVRPGVGTAIGAGIGGVAGLGAGMFSTKSRTRGEQHQRDALIAQGINVPIDSTARDGKAWENNSAFAQSRQESDLTGKDIMGASDFYAQIPGYEKWSPAQQEKAAQQALNSGIVREKLGKMNINISESPDYQKWVEQMQAAQGGQPQGGGGYSRPDPKEAIKKQILSQKIYDPRVTQGTRYDYGELLRNRMA